MPKNSDTQAIGLLLMLAALVPFVLREMDDPALSFLFVHVIEAWTGCSGVGSGIVLFMIVTACFVTGAALFGKGVIEARRLRRDGE